MLRAVMRLAFACAAFAAALLLASCGGNRGPAWPKSAGAVTVDEWEEDGGESIEPQASLATAVERSAEPTPEGKVAEAPPAPAPDEGSGAGSGSGSAAPVEEVPVDLTEIQAEEIIIEIEDD
jgi:hypothetical protein